MLNDGRDEAGTAHGPIRMARKDQIQNWLWNPVPIPSAKIVTVLFQLLPFVLFVLIVLLLLLLLHTE